MGKEHGMAGLNPGHLSLLDVIGNTPAIWLDRWVAHHKLDGRIPNQIKPIQDKPSLVIMPFQNLTNDKENEYIGLGLEVTLSSVLSKSERLTIPSKETGKLLQKNQLTDREIFEEFGFRYVLRGNVQGTPKNTYI